MIEVMKKRKRMKRRRKRRRKEKLLHHRLHIFSMEQVDCLFEKEERRMKKNKVRILLYFLKCQNGAKPMIICLEKSVYDLQRNND